MVTATFEHVVIEMSRQSFDAIHLKQLLQHWNKDNGQHDTLRTFIERFTNCSHPGQLPHQSFCDELRRLSNNEALIWIILAAEELAIVKLILKEIINTIVKPSTPATRNDIDFMKTELRKHRSKSPAIRDALENKQLETLHDSQGSWSNNVLDDCWRKFKNRLLADPVVLARKLHEGSKNIFTDGHLNEVVSSIDKGLTFCGIVKELPILWPKLVGILRSMQLPIGDSLENSLLFLCFDNEMHRLVKGPEIVFEHYFLNLLAPSNRENNFLTIVNKEHSIRATGSSATSDYDLQLKALLGNLYLNHNLADSNGNPEVVHLRRCLVFRANYIVHCACYHFMEDYDEETQLRLYCVTNGPEDDFDDLMYQKDKPMMLVQLCADAEVPQQLKKQFKPNDRFDLHGRIQRGGLQEAIGLLCKKINSKLLSAKVCIDEEPVMPKIPPLSVAAIMEPDNRVVEASRPVDQQDNQAMNSGLQSSNVSSRMSRGPVSSLI